MLSLALDPRRSLSSTRTAPVKKEKGKRKIKTRENGTSRIVEGEGKFFTTKVKSTCKLK